MLRFMKGGYSRNELLMLEYMFKELERYFDECKIGCIECEYKNVCKDISSTRKYLGELLWKK